MKGNLKLLLRFNLTALIMLYSFIISLDLYAETRGVVTTQSGIAMREKPDLNAPDIQHLYLNSHVVILNENGPAVNIDGISDKWYQVKYNNLTGWVFGGYVLKESKELEIRPYGDYFTTYIKSSEESTPESISVKLYKKNKIFIDTIDGFTQDIELHGNELFWIHRDDINSPYQLWMKTIGSKKNIKFLKHCDDFRITSDGKKIAYGNGGDRAAVSIFDRNTKTSKCIVKYGDKGNDMDAGYQLFGWSSDGDKLWFVLSGIPVWQELACYQNGKVKWFPYEEGDDEALEYNNGWFARTSAGSDEEDPSSKTNCTFKIIDVFTGKEALIYQGETAYVFKPSWSSASDLIYYLNGEKTIISRQDILRKFKMPAETIKPKSYISCLKPITSSSDGTRLALIACNNYIYTSKDGGAAWIERKNAGQREWSSIASSADGTKLFAAAVEGCIYTSTDGGATWTEQTSAGKKRWGKIISSSDGTKLAAIADYYIYTSADSGTTWIEQKKSGQKSWISIASSADGTKLAALVGKGYIYTSTDSGITWTEQKKSGQRPWHSIASSADGTKLAAGEENGYIYTSTDSGATWVERANDLKREWDSISSSSDGTKLVAAEWSGYIYTSTDSGATWIERKNTIKKERYSITSSSDGTKLAAVGWGNIIDTSTDSGATWYIRKIAEKDGQSIPPKLEVAEKPDETAYGISKGDKVNVRSNPDIKSKSIDMLNKGEAVVILGKSKEPDTVNGENFYWINVQTISKKKGWVFGKYIHEVINDNTPENNIYRYFLNDYGFSLYKLINSGEIVSRCSLTIDKENLICIWDIMSYWPNGVDANGSRHFYSINNEGKILSSDNYTFGDNYYFTKKAVFFWYNRRLAICDRSELSKPAENAYNENILIKYYKMIFEYSINIKMEKEYNTDKSYLTFDPSTLTLTVYLFPLNNKDPEIKKYKFDEEKLKMIEQ